MGITLVTNVEFVFQVQEQYLELWVVPVVAVAVVGVDQETRILCPSSTSCNRIRTLFPNQLQQDSVGLEVGLILIRFNLIVRWDDCG
jgi:hypothetical protein